MSAGGIAFRIGRKVGKHPLAGILFCLTEQLLPLRRLVRREGLVAFHHPRPVAVPHVLVVPTWPVASITTDRLDDDQMAALIWEVIEMGRELTRNLEPSEVWQLVINGGERQDIGQMHAHLMHAEGSKRAGHSLDSPSLAPETWTMLLANLRAAERVPGNGFSLEIRWSGEHSLRAEVTQSTCT